MGYTHYWSFRKPKGVTAKELEVKYKQAIVECQRVCVAYNKHFTGDDRLSGYAAHTKPGTYGGIKINGKKDNAHEDFVMPEHFADNFKEEFQRRGFCKTARKPYDIAVTACLAILKYRLGDAIEVDSDGRTEDWAEGTLWARMVLKRAVPNPMNTSDESKAFYKRLNGGSK